MAVPLTVSIRTTGAAKAAAGPVCDAGNGGGLSQGMMLALAAVLAGMLLLTGKDKMRWQSVGAFAVLLLAAALSAFGSGSHSTQPSSQTPAGTCTVQKLAPAVRPNSQLPEDAFWLTTADISGVRCLVITASTDCGVLYGVFTLLRKSKPSRRLWSPLSDTSEYRATGMPWPTFASL